MMARHPSNKLLSSWLEGEIDLVEHDEHVNSCTRCASRLEKLSENYVDNVEPITSEFGPALRAVLQPPEDLHRRVNQRIAERIQARDDATLFGAMLGVPAEVTHIVVEPQTLED